MLELLIPPNLWLATAVASDVFLENMIGCRGFSGRREFIGERATRGGAGGGQVGPTCGQGLGHAWVASGGCGPPCRPSSGFVFVSM